MRLIQQIAILALGLVVIGLPKVTTVQAQTSQLQINVVQNDQVAGGFLVIQIEAKATSVAPNSTVGSGTIDFDYDPAHLTPLAIADGVLLAADGYAISVTPLNDGADYIRTTITSSNIGTGFGQDPGYDLGTSYENLQSIQFEITAAGITAGTTDLIFRQGSAALGYYDSPSNSNGTSNINQYPIDFFGDAAAIELDPSLPVELVNFDVTVDNNDALLTWTTASEAGNSGFAVEYSVEDEDSWSELAFVESAGDSNSETGYTYRAVELGFGTFNFRLRQVDVDGSSNYSAEVEVSIDVPTDYVLGAPYPNPFNPSASFTLALKEQQEVRVELYNMLGQMIEVLHSGVLGSNETHTFSIDGASLSSGMYLVRIAGDNFTTTQTATLLK